MQMVHGTMWTCHSQRCDKVRREIALKLMDMLYRATKGEEVSDSEIDSIAEEMTPEEIDEFALAVLEALKRCSQGG